ncbi:MAG: FIST N-terminal domain-containing protein [Myxococcota bacterium]
MAAAAADLAEKAERELGGSSSIGGGFLLATSAAGEQGQAVGQYLAECWPEADLLGTSFEGILGEGQVWRDEPALGLFVWEEGADPPLSFVFGQDELAPSRVAEELLASVDLPELGPEDLVLLFPDATGSPGWPVFLDELRAALGNAQIAGAAASGFSEGPALGWSGEEACPGALTGLLILGGDRASRDQQCTGGGLRVAAASATREASPWLEITGCRSRWVDELEEEPPLDWVRRQLGLDGRARIEPYLDRLMARVRRRIPLSDLNGDAHAPEADAEEGDADRGYEEQFLIGLDARRGAISLPGVFERGDELAFALPDADLARKALRASVDALAESPLILQFACRARDENLHGDRDVESALVAHHAGARATLGTLAPFQVGPDTAGETRTLVHSTVLAALGDEEDS